MTSRRYALWGALFGLLFPICALLLQALLQPSPAGFASSVAHALAMPLMWIVATAPIVLGVGGWWVGGLEDRHLAAERTSRLALSDFSKEISRASQKLFSTVSSFSALASQNAASVRETMSNMSQLAHTAQQAALTAETVVGVATSTQRSSESGLKAANEASAEMVKLAEDVRELASRIEGLNDRMRDIFEIASVVDTVAERSQILAAEAAREVEKNPAAQGFAAIVGQMRQHAEDARSSAQRVKKLLGEGHKAMMAAMTAAEKGAQRAERGAEVARSSGSAIQRLAQALQESSKAARDIANVAQMQDKGVDEVQKAMNEIFLATEETVAGTREVAGGAHSLMELSERMQKLLRR
ncbi:MAG TPA: methyl-accepting chemotaxis protein [Anaeromyxobacter sp.]|nr:methyl-accepting chemotaxis protein [Anaeromyxobacter sp.]